MSSQALEPKGPLEVMRHASAVFLNRAMLALRAGITYKGKRDLYDALGYQRILRPIDFRSRYARGGIAKRVADALPKATWRGGAEILENEDPGLQTEFETAVEEFSRKHKLWTTLCKADILSQQGQFSVLLIGAPGDLREPLDEQLSADDIAYIQPYSQEDVLVQRIDTKSDSERFGLPDLYQIRRLAGSAYFGYAVGSKLVHHSRIIHVADGRLDDRIFGHPILETVWNYLDDLDKIGGAGAEAFWKRADQGIIFDLDKDTEMSPTETAAIKDAADEFINGYRRVMGTRGMKAQQMGSDVADLSKPIDAILTLIAGATGIPKRILVGSERGELASTQDRENWEQRITDRRSDYAEPEILRPLLQRFIDLGVFPQPQELIIRWPDIEYLNETEQAAIAVQWANINKQMGAVVVLPEEIRDRILRLEKLEAHQLPDPDSPFATPEMRRQPQPEQLADPNLDPYTDRLSDEVPTPATNLAPLAIARRAGGEGSGIKGHTTDKLDVASAAKHANKLGIKANESGDAQHHAEAADAYHSLLSSQAKLGTDMSSFHIRGIKAELKAHIAHSKGLRKKEDYRNLAAKYVPVSKASPSKQARAEVKKRLKGAAKFHIKKALRAAKAAHNPAAVRTAHTRGKQDVLLAMAPPLATLRTLSHKAKHVVAEVHHRSRKVTRLIHKTGAPGLKTASAALRIAVQVSDSSIEYAAQKAADAITDLDAQARENINSLIEKAFEKGWTAEKLADRLGDVVPLSSQQSSAVENLRSKLEDAQPGDVVEFGDRSATVPTDGGSDEWIDKQTSRYADDLLDERAELIAETSIDQAAADGQRDEWNSLREDGELSENTLRRFIAGDDACDDCQELDGEVAELDEEYDGGSNGPLVHPRCDCDEELFEPKES